MNRTRVAVAFTLVALAGCPKDGDKDSAGPTTTATTDETAADTGASTAATATTTTTTTTTTMGEGELQYCPGAPEVSDPCLADDDCPQGQSAYCSPTENDCPGAGCPMFCQDDTECGEGTVCVFSGTGCCAGQVSDCVPACTPDSCAPGDACLPNGHCAPIACDGGYTCPDGWSCMPGATGADGHGCVIIPCDQQGALPCVQLFGCVAGACQRLTCEASADCPCGTCVQGQCWERPWLCTEPSA